MLGKKRRRTAFGGGQAWCNLQTSFIHAWSTSEHISLATLDTAATLPFVVCLPVWPSLTLSTGQTSCTTGETAANCSVLRL